jgi:N-acetylglutamate synthase-like GNAT family acetyltransferase
MLQAMNGRACANQLRTEKGVSTMTVALDRLSMLAESTSHLFDEASGVFPPVGIAGVTVRSGQSSSPVVNMVGMARLDETNVDRTIQQVLDYFSTTGTPFGWLVGPSSTPVDLCERLEAAGLTKLEVMHGMALTDLSQPIRSNPAITIKAASYDETRDAAEMMSTAMSDALPVEPDDAKVLVSALEELQDRYPNQFYLAFVEGNPNPIGFGALCGTEDPRVMVLPGAATLKEYRGQGVYSSMLARRVADARAQGAEAVVIQAVSHTSAPICKKFGFEIVCSMDVFAWMPTDN